MSDKPVFKKPLRYSGGRASKAAAVYERYSSILDGRVLDVGADQCYLRNHLPDEAKYTPVGLGDHPDHVVVNLETDPLPFEDRSFDSVLCLDVLEHLEHIHDAFGELFRVSSRWVLVALPNPWVSFLECLQRGPFTDEEPFKFYGLPLERPQDRHRWFFSASDSETFVEHHAKKHGFHVCDVYRKGRYEIEGKRQTGLFAKYREHRIAKARELVFGAVRDLRDLKTWTMWFVLQRTN